MNAEERALCIARIAALPDQIELLMRGLTPQQLVAHYLTTEWSVAQNVHHLFDSHANCYIRCKLIVTEHEPPLKAYDQDGWAMLADGSEADIANSLVLLRALHNRWVRFWRNLRAEDFARTGLHSQYGPMSLDQIVRSYAEHGEAHIDQIRRTLAAGGIEK
jgi:hypothetical protein